MNPDIKGFLAWVFSGFKSAAPVQVISKSNPAGRMSVTMQGGGSMSQVARFASNARTVNAARGIAVSPMAGDGTVKAKVMVSPNGAPDSGPVTQAAGPTPDTTSPLIPGGKQVDAMGNAYGPIVESDNGRAPWPSWWGHEFGNGFQFPRASTSKVFTVPAGTYQIEVTDGLAIQGGCSAVLNGYGPINDGDRVRLSAGDYTVTVTASRVCRFTINVHGPE